MTEHVAEAKLSKTDDLTQPEKGAITANEELLAQLGYTPEEAAAALTTLPKDHQPNRAERRALRFRRPGKRNGSRPPSRRGRAERTTEEVILHDVVRRIMLRAAEEGPPEEEEE